MASYQPRPCHSQLGLGLEGVGLLPSMGLGGSLGTAAASLPSSSGGLRGPVTAGPCHLRTLSWPDSTGSLGLLPPGPPLRFLEGSVFGPFTAFQGPCPCPLPQAPFPLHPQPLCSQVSGADLPCQPHTQSFAWILCIQTKADYYFGGGKKKRLICLKFLTVDKGLLC